MHRVRNSKYIYYIMIISSQLLDLELLLATEVSEQRIHDLSSVVSELTECFSGARRSRSAAWIGDKSGVWRVVEEVDSHSNSNLELCGEFWIVVCLGILLSAT